MLSDGILASVVDPRHFAADLNPDPAFHFYADLADQILPFSLMRIRILPFNFMRIRMQIWILLLTFFQIWTLQCPKMTL
jgi:hypothetical protein